MGRSCVVNEGDMQSEKTRRRSGTPVLAVIDQQPETRIVNNVKSGVRIRQARQGYPVISLAHKCCKSSAYPA